MLYFAKKEIPSDADLNQIKKVREFKKEFRNKSLYGDQL